MIKKILLVIAVVLILLVAGFFILIYPSYSKFLKTETLPFDKSLTIVIGGGGNSGILVTDSVVLVIDTKMGKAAEAFFKLVKEKAGSKKIIVINTHYHGDHINGNKFYKGSPIYIGNYEPDFLQKNVKPDLMPTKFIKDSLTMILGKDTVLLYNVGQAHTMNDVIVYLKNRKLLFTGDLVFNKMNPVLKKESGANVDKWINVLNHINAIDINTIVPGHGKLGGKELVTSLLQYFEDMKMAASDPSKAPELKAKYSDWLKMHFMCSPDNTISYIKSSKS